MMAFKPGVYEHECPGCGAKQVFRVDGTVLRAERRAAVVRQRLIDEFGPEDGKMAFIGLAYGASSETLARRFRKCEPTVYGDPLGRQGGEPAHGDPLDVDYSTVELKFARLLKLSFE